MKFELEAPEIAQWANRYWEHEDKAVEKAAFDSGGRLRRGQGTPESLCDDLEIIGRWKSPRTVPLLRRNAPAEIAEACLIAAQTSSDGCAIAVLQCLHGVRVPMASAILTAMNQQKHTVIDWRAREALGQARREPTIGDYVCHVVACRLLAAKHGVSLRKLDRALLAWSKNHPKSS